MADSKKIQELLTRGVEEIVDQKKLETKLNSGRCLRVKLGIDPTSSNIHLGRSIPLLKLRDFQELGHQIVFIIGDFTGIIGDTSDKTSERPMLDPEVIKNNLETYIEQAAKIIDVKRAEIHYNSTWLKELKYLEIGEQANLFSLNEFISRDNINRRLQDGKRISLRELLYPLMQGYDSVQVKADVEVGGTEQRFNLLTGRSMQRHYQQEAQDIITNPLIEGLDGRKMSSSFGNTVNLFDAPNDMFGKIMSLQDELIIKYFILLTRVEMSIIKDYEVQLQSGLNPRDLKLLLAQELVKTYHSDVEAQQARDYFMNVFSKKEIPDQMPEFKPQNYNLISILLDSQLVTSKSEARRLLEQGGIKINGDVCRDADLIVQSDSILQKGKLKFLKIK